MAPYVTTVTTSGDTNGSNVVILIALCIQNREFHTLTSSILCIRHVALWTETVCGNHTIGVLLCSTQLTTTHLTGTTWNETEHDDVMVWKCLIWVIMVGESIIYYLLTIYLPHMLDKNSIWLPIYMKKLNLPTFPGHTVILIMAIIPDRRI